MTSRKAVPEKTKRILFIKSRNRCAYPGCTNPLVLLPTGNAPHKIIGEICHIHSDKENGPRGIVGLTREKYNAYENLIMLCPNHHRKVDGQHEAHPAETLKEWKVTHESKSYIGSLKDLETPADVFYHRFFPTALVDQAVEDEVDRLRKYRLFPEFDGLSNALNLARKLSEAELSGGTAAVRACALAWCARILSIREDELDRADEYVKLAKTLGGDTRIAEAFICSQRGDRETALNLLSHVDASDSRFAAYRSASFRIVGNLDGPEKAMNWLDDVSFDAKGLDPDGKSALLSFHLELCQWTAAVETARALSERELEEAPVLHFMKAISYLLDTVPSELRMAVFRHAVISKLDSRTNAIETRRISRHHFTRAAQIAETLGCPNAVETADRFATWLELADPEYSDKGKVRLADRLNDLQAVIHLIPLALQFGIPICTREAEKAIKRQTALAGSATPSAALALLALARIQETPNEAIDFLDRHRRTLLTHLEISSVRSVQIQLLARAGLIGKAYECLEEPFEGGFSELETCRLRIAVEKAEGKDTLEAQKALYRQSDALGDLEALIFELGIKREWSEQSEYGEILFDRTHSLEDAVQLANALNLAEKPAQTIKLLESNYDIVSLPVDLQMLYCWSLLQEGELLEARRKMAELSVNWEDENYRTLQVHLSVALEDSDSLSVALARGYRRTKNRSAQELLRAAGLSLSLNPRSAKRLLYAAAEKGNEDAHVLSQAYFLAVKAGWEADTKIASWLQRASDLSGEDGPLWSVTPSELLDMLPEWDRQELNIRKQLNRGEAPMFFAAQLLNRSLIKMILSPALANSAEHDLRRKIGVPTFSGQRGPSELVAGGKIGLDYTALLTLGFLDLLDKVFDAFSTVYVPHSTFTWLFEERQSASHNQPNEVKDAQLVLDLLRVGSLEKVSHRTQADKTLKVLVGEDLALLIAEAEDIAHEGRQRLVVRPNPVHEIPSLGEEEADLTRHYPVLSSCQAIVKKLYDLGEIDESAEKNAGAYLQRREKPWPDQPEIDENAILYLDDLSVYYLIRTGLLEILCRLKFKLIISPSLESRSNAHITYERFSEKVIDTLEDISSVVKQGVDSGKVKIGKRRNIGNGDEQYLNDFQIAELLAIAEDCEVIIVDDRFFNQVGYIEHRDVQASLYTTLDLLDSLASSGQMSGDDRQMCRTRLRRAGYYLIPVTEDELTIQLKATEEKDGKVIERAHLRAIRESILHARMNDWLQLPKDATWFEMTEKAFVGALRTLWKVDTDLAGVIARSNWILDQLDIENGDKVLESSRNSLILVLLVPPTDAPEKIRNAYRNWAEERILVPYKDLYPDLFNLIVTDYKSRISDFANQEQINGLKVADIPNGRVLSAMAMLDIAPSLIREALLDDGQFLEELGIEVASSITFEDYGVSFQRSDLYAGIRQMLSGASSLRVTDTEGQDWVLSDIGDNS